MKTIQRKLISLGYDLGPGGADGIAGKMTTAAIAKFQKDFNVQVMWPGTIGSKTLAALGLVDIAPAHDVALPLDPPWLGYARTFLGLHEVRDAKKLDKALKLDASGTAWCGAFVGMVLGNTLPSEGLPANPLGSRNWMKFGQELDLNEPKLGAIAVFWRGSINGWQGHVAFVAGHEKGYVHCLGGNQSDSVSISKVSKSRLLGYRYPKSFAVPTSKLEMTSIQATITTNEA